MATAPLNPTPALLCKLGSIMMHAAEMMAPHGHTFDRIALEQLLDDPEVREWQKAMDGMGMLPKMRHGFEKSSGKVS
jgi:hypothetical protein